MTTKNDGGPVFPTPVVVTGMHNTVQAVPGGISRRDWLAGLAMQALLASDEFSDAQSFDIARWSYQQADDMIAEGEK